MADIVIKIPEKEFGIEINDKFQDFFKRLKIEIKERLISGTELICGAYELETIEMFLNAFANAIYLPSEVGWIPVSERLPKDHENVLIWLKSNHITIGVYNSHKLPFNDRPIGWGVDAEISVHNFFSDDVLAWMPLPAPYESQESKNT